MPAVDMPIEELKKYMGRNPKPADAPIMTGLRTVPDVIEPVARSIPMSTGVSTSMVRTMAATASKAS